MQALKKQKAFLSGGGEEKDDRKRKYNSMTSTEVRQSCPHLLFCVYFFAFERLNDCFRCGG